MTSFWTLFKQLFKQKNKSANLVFLIQLAAAIVTMIMAFIGTINTSSFKFQIGPDISLKLFSGVIVGIIVTFLGYSFLANPAYIIITSWKNEKVNRSQTWRLVPMNDGLIYVCNTLSSFASFVYLIVLQAIMAVLAAIITYASSDQVRSAVAIVLNEMGRISRQPSVWEFLGDSLLMVLLASLLGLFWYVIVSFLHFTSRAIIDFLPNGSNKFLVFVVRLIVLIAVVYILTVLGNLLGNIGLDSILGNNNDFAVSMIPAFIDIIILDLIFGIVNFLLINKFVEAKQSR